MKEEANEKIEENNYQKIFKKREYRKGLVIKNEIINEWREK